MNIPNMPPAHGANTGLSVRNAEPGLKRRHIESPGIMPNDHAGAAKVHAPQHLRSAGAWQVNELASASIVTVERGQAQTWPLSRRPSVLAGELDEDQVKIVDEVWQALACGQGLPLNAQQLPDGSLKREYGVSTPEYLTEVTARGLALRPGEGTHQYQVVVHARQGRVLSLAVDPSFDPPFFAVYEPGEKMQAALERPATAPDPAAGRSRRAMMQALEHRQLQVKEHKAAAAEGLGVALLRHATQDFDGSHKIAVEQVLQALGQAFPQREPGAPLQPDGEAARWLMRHVMDAYGDGLPRRVVLLEAEPQGRPVVRHEEGPHHGDAVVIAVWGDGFAAVENASGRAWQEHLTELTRPVTTEQQAQAIAQRLPRRPMEAKAVWARRIHKHDAEVQAMDYEPRIRVLAVVTGAPRYDLREISALKDLPPLMEQQVQAILDGLPRNANEFNLPWARRIYQNDPVVRAMDYESRIEMLAAVTEARPSDLRQEPALKDPLPVVAQQARAIAARLPRTKDERNATWARRIYLNDPVVRAMDYEARIDVLAAVVEARASYLRREVFPQSAEGAS